MNFRPKKKQEWGTCDIPRKHEAIEALLALAWRKEKKERQSPLIKEIDSYC